MVKANLKNLVRNVGIVNRLEYSSDHKMLRMEIDLRKPKKNYKKFLLKITVNNDETQILKFQLNLAKEISSRKLSEAADNVSKGVKSMNAQILVEDKLTKTQTKLVEAVDNVSKGAMNAKSINVQVSFDDITECLISAEKFLE